MKKVLSVLLVAILCFMVVPTAHAEENESFFFTYTSITGVKPDSTKQDTKADSTTLTYNKISRDSFNDYLAVLNKLRFVPFALKTTNADDLYYFIYHVYSGSNGFVTYNEKKQVLSIQAYEDTVFVTNESATKQIAQLDAIKIHNNGSAQGYVLPQFYAIGGDAPTWDGQTASDYVFDGKKCWTEIYDDVSLKSIDYYLLFMYKFGCDIEGTYISFDDTSSYIDTVIFNLNQNDETLVRLTCSLDSGSVTVNYNPAPSKPYDLKSGNELAAMIEIPE